MEPIPYVTIQEIVFDESGNSGADLLNDQQPVFSLASSSVSAATASALFGRARGTQAAEAKFSRLKRSASGRQRLISLLASPELTSDNVLVTVVHKRFMLVAKIVDLLVEPLLHRSGYDAFENGFNLSYSNLLFKCFPAYLDSRSLDDLFHHFLEMVSLRTPEATRGFYRSANLIFNRCPAPFSHLFAPIVVSQGIVAEILEHNDKLSLDPAIPEFFRHCALWGNRLGAPFQLLHDDSKPILQDKVTLESLMSPEEDGLLIGYDRRQFVFPLRSQSITFGRSRDDARLQLADLVASAGAHWAKGAGISEHQTAFWHNLADAGIRRFWAGGIWPSEALSPEELGTIHTGGIEAISHMADFLARRVKS